MRKKDPAAVALGRKRWEGVSAAERSRLMKLAAAKPRQKLNEQRRKKIGAGSRAYWAALSPEERSSEMKRRAKVRERNRKAEATKPKRQR
jgi:hypothetical protein